VPIRCSNSLETGEMDLRGCAGFSSSFDAGSVGGGTSVLVFTRLETGIVFDPGKVARLEETANVEKAWPILSFAVEHLDEKTMPVRRVFFRDPTGKPYRKEDDKHAPAHLLAHLGKSGVIDAEGRVAFRRWGTYHYALASSFVVLDDEGAEINGVDSGGIVWKAIGQAARENLGSPIPPRKVLRAADRLVAAYLLQPLVKYVLVTSLSVHELPS
jgi:hypothetical protein